MKHDILALLRKLRDTGYSGRINPATIRKHLPAITSPGRILCELRSDGCLIKVGNIHLPAHRGKTLANEYLINPKHDLMLKQHYDIGKHDKTKAARDTRTVCSLIDAYLLGGLWVTL